MAFFKAFIRVVKSLAVHKDQFGSYSNPFDKVQIVREPLIEAQDKAEVKQILVDRYPQFFQNGKIYERETKDQAQFFYVVIFPLYDYEVQIIERGQWVCAYCGHVHENAYVSPPKQNERLLGAELMFCKDDDSGHSCLDSFWRDKNKDVEMPDDEYYIKTDSPNYIYKVTEKATGKSYIGKTRNAPFFRWWNHLTRSATKFGTRLQQTKLSEWTFEVLEELPANTPDTEIFRIESEYILKYDCISNGYNSLISNKSVNGTGKLFENE